MPGTDLPLLQGREEETSPCPVCPGGHWETWESNRGQGSGGEDKPWLMVLKCESDPRGEGLGAPRFKFSLAGAVCILFASSCGTVCLAGYTSHQSGLYAGLKRGEGAWLKWKCIPRRAHPAFLQALAIPVITASVVRRSSFPQEK